METKPIPSHSKALHPILSTPPSSTSMATATSVEGGYCFLYPFTPFRTRPSGLTCSNGTWTFKRSFPATSWQRSYVGSKGTHLTQQRNLNQLLPVSSGNPFAAGQPITSADCNSLSA